MQTTIHNKNDDNQTANDIFALIQFLKSVNEHSEVVVLFKSGIQISAQVNKQLSELDHGVLFCHTTVQRPSKELQQMINMKTSGIILLSQVSHIAKIINEAPIIEGKN